MCTLYISVNMTCWAGQGFKTCWQWRLLFQWMVLARAVCTGEAAALLRMKCEDTKRHRMLRLSRDTIPEHDKGAHVSRLSFLVIPTSISPLLLLSSTPEYRVVPRPDCPSWRAIYGRVFTLNSVLTVLTIFASHLRAQPRSCVSTLFCGEKCSSW